MLVSDWNIDRKQDKLRHTILEQMFSEIEHNKKILTYSVEYHGKLSLTLDGLFQNLDKDELQKRFIDGQGFHQIPNWTGLGVGTMSSSVFEIAKISSVLPGIKPEVLEKILRA